MPVLIKQSKITVRSSKQEYEVADVIRQFEAAYRQKYAVSQEQRRVMGSLKACRTAALGGHIFECNKCGALAACRRENNILTPPTEPSNYVNKNRA